VTQEKENAAQPSAAFTAMSQFCAANSNATKLLHAAAIDYASARCLLLNGLVSVGLAIGAQAIEKFLKAYVLLKDPSKNVRSAQHSLSHLLNEADRISPGLGLSKYVLLMMRYEGFL
jgi:HEPN domain-containing protein